MQDINYAAIAPQVIELLKSGDELLGRPFNRSMSNQKEMRFGKKGSFSVDLEKAAFFDNESESGGGLKDLIREVTGREPNLWLKENGFVQSTLMGDFSDLTRKGEVYIYTDEHGEPKYQVERSYRNGERFFKQSSFTPDGKIKSGKGAMQGVQRLPYRLADIANQPEATVYIVEGEKDADRLAAAGLVATCNPGGAKNWKAELNDHFINRDIVIIQDNDDTGKEHAILVANALKGKAKRIKVIDLQPHWPEMPEKGDVSDFLDAGHTITRLEEITAQTAAYGFEDAKEWLREASIDDDFITQKPAPRKMVVEGILPQGITGAIGGRGGVGKSFCSLQLGISVASGIPFFGHEVPEPGQVLILSAEDDREEVQRRFHSYMSQAIANELMTGEPTPDIELLKKNLLIKSLVGEQLLFTQADGNGVAMPTPDVDLIASYLSMLDNPKLIIVDTYSRFNGGKENSNEDAAQFVKACERLSKRTGATVLIMAHMRKGSRGEADDLAGGARFVDSTRWSATLDPYLLNLGADKLEKAGMSLQEASQFVAFRIVKDNYLGQLNHLIYMSRSHGGVLVQSEDMTKQIMEQTKAKPKAETHFDELSKRLVEFLADRNKNGEVVTANKLKEVYAGRDGRFGVSGAVLMQILDKAVTDGLVVKLPIPGKKGQSLHPA